MQNKIEITWPSEIGRKTDPTHPFFLKYIHPANMPLISRKGLYSNCWDLLSKTYSSESGFLHQAHSLIIPDEMSFFKIVSEESSTKKSRLLIIALLDPWLMPIHSLNDSLLHLKNKIDLTNIELYSFTVGFSAFSPLRHLNYINAFYQTLSQNLGQIPQAVELLDLQKMSSMKEWNIYEAGTSWLCSDNFLTHLSLSKGAGLVNYCVDHNLKQAEKFSISRYHSIEIGTISKRIDRGPFDLYLSLSDDELSKESFSELKVPDVFMSLLYKTLGNQ